MKTISDYIKELPPERQEWISQKLSELMKKYANNPQDDIVELNSGNKNITNNNLMEDLLKDE